jgi:hypothetical protein
MANDACDIAADSPQGSPPGAPGIAPTRCSSAKDAVGCAPGPSRVWFTSGGGIVNEVYCPRVDIPRNRDLGFIVADDQGFRVEVKRLGNHRGRIMPGVSWREHASTPHLAPQAKPDQLFLWSSAANSPAGTGRLNR